MILLKNPIVISWFIPLLIGLFIPWAPAAEEKPVLQGWQKKRAEILVLIDREVLRRVAEEVTEESTAAVLKISLPVVKPQKTADQLFREIRSEAEKNALSNRPLKALQMIVQEAESKYPLYQIGDEVQVRLRIKTNPLASGVIHSISDERVQIGTRWIPIRDIAEEQRFAFDRQKTMDLRQNYITRQNNLQMAMLKNATDQIFQKILPGQMEKEGFLPVNPDSAELLNLDNWLAAEAVLNRELLRLRKEAEVKLRPQIENQLFTENGFKYYENKKEWRPAGVLQGLKNLFE